MTNENIIMIDYKDEMEKSYIDYAMSVIIQRALPDIRDGLKPVHRRILFAMNELNNFPDKPHKKSARIVGDVLGKYHPHGDSSVYDAMVRLSQDFSLLMPLVDGHGNFGSIDGDSPAAMRYTEARLSPLAMELLYDLDKNLVDYKPNFDNTLKEPIVLPSKFPNLLVNGSSGIAVGMATNIPPHNLNEVINATIALLDKPEITTSGLMKYIKGPDFPTGGLIINKEDLLNIYETGNGKIRVRAKLETEDAGYGRKNIVVTEIPYTFSGSKTYLIESLITLVTDKKLDEISDIRDESSKDGMRIIIEVKKGVNIDNFIKKLYKRSKLEDVFSVNLLGILNNSPSVFSLKDMIFHYVEFLKEINLNKLQYELKKNEDRKEVLEGFIRAVDVIDLIIEIIRGSKDISMVKKCLIEGVVDGIKLKTKKSQKDASRLLFTEKQANAILGMQLQRLVGLEIDKLMEEDLEVEKAVNFYTLLLNNDEELRNYIKEDLNRIKKNYGVKRKTVIDSIEEEEEYVEEVIEEDVYALIDRFGYIKLIDNLSYTRTSEETFNDYKEVMKISNTDSLCIFTKDGNMHQIKAKDIQMSKIRDRGVPIDNLCDIKNIDDILLISPFKDIFNKVMFTTLLGYVKLVEPEEFITNRKMIYATKLKSDDVLLDIKMLKEDDCEVTLTTKEDRVLRFLIDEIPIQKRGARGVIGINLNKGDELSKVEISAETDKRKRRRGAKGAV